MKDDFIDIVFDGPPSHTSGRFVEVEDAHGAGIQLGEWVNRNDGYWVLRIPNIAALQRDLAWERQRNADNIAQWGEEIERLRVKLRERRCQLRAANKGCERASMSAQHYCSVSIMRSNQIQDFQKRLMKAESDLAAMTRHRDGLAEALEGTVDALERAASRARNGDDLCAKYDPKFYEHTAHGEFLAINRIALGSGIIAAKQALATHAAGREGEG